MKKNGFTLIELLIAISILSVAFVGIGEIITLSLDSYLINVEMNTSIDKITPIIKRIENRLIITNSIGINTLIKPEITNFVKNIDKIYGIQIKDRNNNSYWYWWDNSTGSVYRGTGIVPDVNNDILLFKGNVTVEVNDFYFKMYGVDDMYKTFYTELVEEVKYLTLNVKIKGKEQKVNLNFSTGFKLP